MASPSVVLIEDIGEDGNPTGRGSGFLVTADGRILTAFHVIQHTKHAKVTLTNHDVYDLVSVLDVDRDKDIAFLKIKAVNLPYLKLGRSASAQVGNKLFAIGNPFGYENTLSEGLLSGIRQAEGFTLFQLSAPVSPGSSGGPVLTSQGEVIGIVEKQIPEGQNLNFAIPTDYAAVLLEARELRPLADFYEPAGSERVVSTSPAKSAAEDFPTHWKSLISGTVKIIRRDGDRLYVETAMSDVQKNAGCFQMADLQQKGSDFFAGTARFSCVCQYAKGWGASTRTLTNRYTTVTTIEITKLSATRIEGRTVIPSKDSKLDCETGTFTKPPNKWEEFVWIPQ
jgi:hypothetical protein